MTEIVQTYEEIPSEGHLSDQCEALIKRLNDESDATTIVIDGLDKCSHTVQITLLTSIASLLDDCLEFLEDIYIKPP